MPSATNFHRNPGMPHMPVLNVAANFAKEISDEIELSNIQMMNGIIRNKNAPLTRCMPEAKEASGQRNERKLAKSMLRNSGRFVLVLVDDSDIRLLSVFSLGPCGAGVYRHVEHSIARVNTYCSRAANEWAKCSGYALQHGARSGAAAKLVRWRYLDDCENISVNPARYGSNGCQSGSSHA